MGKNVPRKSAFEKSQSLETAELEIDPRNKNSIALATKSSQQNGKILTDAKVVSNFAKINAWISVTKVKSKTSRSRSKDSKDIEILQTPFQIEVDCSSNLVKLTAQIRSKTEDFNCFAHFQRK